MSSFQAAKEQNVIISNGVIIFYTHCYYTKIKKYILKHQHVRKIELTFLWLMQQADGFQICLKCCAYF